MNTLDFKFTWLKLAHNFHCYSRQCTELFCQGRPQGSSWTIPSCCQCHGQCETWQGSCTPASCGCSRSWGCGCQASQTLHPLSCTNSNLHWAGRSYNKCTEGWYILQLATRWNFIYQLIFKSKSYSEQINTSPCISSSYHSNITVWFYIKSVNTISGTNN